MPSKSCPSSSKPTNCTVCGDDLPSSDHSVIEKSPVCTACVQQLFELSLASENNFPPRWGQTILDPMEFKDALDEAFLERYARCDKKWSCPPTERVYCHGKTNNSKLCERFLGQRAEMKTRMEYVCCKRCWWLTCLACLETFDLGEDPAREPGDDLVEVEHVCSKTKTADPFGGLKRGKEYQICPNEKCRRPAELAAGCNHIACPCGTSYCFICAAPSEELSDHWEVGGCPRYGQPGSASALYNDDIRLANDDAGSDVEDEDLWRWQMQTLVEQEGGQLPVMPDRSRTSRSHGRRNGSTQGVASGSSEPHRARRSDRPGRPTGDQGLDNGTDDTGDHSARAGIPPTIHTRLPGPRPKRGLRQIVRERGQDIIQRFR